MAPSIYTQTIIAVIWDFDRTLIPGYSQQPIFDHFEISADDFWAETNALRQHYSRRGLLVGADTAYLNRMITYVENGKMPGLTNTRLKEFGAEIEMCPGVPEIFEACKQVVTSNERFVKHELSVEHYVISTGLRPLIEGSQVGPHVEHIWANELVDNPPPPGYLTDDAEGPVDEGPIAQVGYTIDNTTKTRAIFEINKGLAVDVNSLVPEEDRRVPIRNMLYVADGPSDVPVFSVVAQYGGRCFGVYQAGEKTNFDKVKTLEDQGRVSGVAEADFREGKHAYLWITTTIGEIAERICLHRERYLGGFGAAPGHVV